MGETFGERTSRIDALCREYRRIAHLAHVSNSDVLKTVLADIILFCARERLVAESLIERARLEADSVSRLKETEDTDQPSSAAPESLSCATRQHIENVLAGHNFNISASARSLGMSRRGLLYKMRRLGIELPKRS